MKFLIIISMILSLAACDGRVAITPPDAAGVYISWEVDEEPLYTCLVPEKYPTSQPAGS